MRPNLTLRSEASHFYDSFLTWTFLSTMDLCVTFLNWCTRVKCTCANGNKFKFNSLFFYVNMDVFDCCARVSCMKQLSINTALRLREVHSHLLMFFSIQTSPLQPSYNMSSWPNPLSPSPSNLSHTLTGTHTHYQHISPHWHLPHSVQAGSGNPTAQKTYIKHFSFRKLQTCLSPSIRSENTRTSCLQPALTVSFTVQQTGC